MAEGGGFSRSGCGAALLGEWLLCLGDVSCVCGGLG